MESDLTEKPTFELLLNQNLHDLIKHLSSRFMRAYGYRGASAVLSPSDLQQEAYIAAHTAYQTFDHTRVANDIHTGFRTYAFPYIKHAIDAYCRRHRHQLSISEKASRRDLVDLMNNVSVVRLSEDEDDEFDIPVGSGVEDKSELEEHLFYGLQASETNLLKDHFVEKCSYRELGRRYNISASKACMIVNRLQNQLKERLDEL